MGRREEDQKMKQIYLFEDKKKEDHRPPAPEYNKGTLEREEEIKREAYKKYEPLNGPDVRENTYEKKYDKFNIQEIKERDY